VLFIKILLVILVKTSILSISIASFLLAASLHILNASAQQGGDAVGGSAIGGPSINGSASIICQGTTCIYNFPGGPATGGPATGESGAEPNVQVPSNSRSTDDQPVDHTVTSLPPPFILKWGIKGTGDGQFHNPSGIATDSADNVYVVELGNKRVQKFDSSGNFITKWGTNGTENGQFDSPQGIATDSAGNVYVADTDNHRVQKFRNP
jgi:DNA-binding beta-propeller fold protein YncE